MNAGAEYVLYRIWATVQDHRGIIHVESLLTCLGALAGYACQACVRQTAALPGADTRKYALMPVRASDGNTYLGGDALNVPLSESPMSVWALVGRAVQKLGEPVPDLEDILKHVTQTVGTSAFGVARMPAGHRSHHSAVDYLKQIWPQILPIARRFCNKPAQLPVLFGIALQRAIEVTQNLLSPTLSASIAMECAVAMSKVALPEADLAEAAINAPMNQPRLAAPGVISALTPPMGSPERGMRAEPKRGRATPEAKRKGRGVGRVADADPNARNVRSLIASVPPATRMVTIAALAFITIAGAMWKGEGVAAPDAVREQPRIQSAGLTGTLRVVDQPAQEAQVTPDEPVAAPVSEPEVLPEPPPELAMNEEIPRQIESGDGSAEIVPPPELMTSSDPVPTAQSAASEGLF